MLTFLFQKTTCNARVRQDELSYPYPSDRILKNFFISITFHKRTWTFVDECIVIFEVK